jgi:hypothetical protein
VRNRPLLVPICLKSPFLRLLTDFLLPFLIFRHPPYILTPVLPRPPVPIHSLLLTSLPIPFLIFRHLPSHILIRVLPRPLVPIHSLLLTDLPIPFLIFRHPPSHILIRVLPRPLVSIYVLLTLLLTDLPFPFLIFRLLPPQVLTPVSSTSNPLSQLPTRLHRPPWLSQHWLHHSVTDNHMNHQPGVLAEL